MYTACIACNRDLGRNDVVESFPAGRRLAFDAKRGRLWVICPHCHRWNLTPLDERWEAVEACERLYRDTRTRVSTGQIGLAKLRDGSELVGVGEPLRPEFAAWRYGRHFASRRRNQIIVSGAVVAGAGAVVVGGFTGALSVITLWQIGRTLFSIAEHGNPSATAARLLDESGRLLRVRRAHLLASRIVADERGALGFSVKHDAGTTLFAGDDARRAAASLLPAVNRFAGTREDVDQAVGRIERAGGPDAFLATLGRHASRLTEVVPVGERERFVDSDAKHMSGLLALPSTLGLAIEMAVHEERERRAMEGELAELERAWKDAEQIAAIADDLALPSTLGERLARLKQR